MRNEMTTQNMKAPPTGTAEDAGPRRPYTTGAVAFVVLLLLAGVQCALALLEEVLA